tara:strand:+ start:1417 stop:1854 length:438 start_codon:yes stop_codon:yes gene_type:complete
MSELIIISSFAFIIISFLMIKNSLSEIFLGLGVLLSIYPVLAQIDSMLAVILIITFLVFEMMALTDLYRHKRSFNQKRSYKTALIWLSICLTMGTSLVYWIKQKEISSTHLPIAINEHWWKIILIMALVIFSASKEKKLIRDEHD